MLTELPHSENSLTGCRTQASIKNKQLNRRCKKKATFCNQGATLKVEIWSPLIFWLHLLQRLNHLNSNSTKHKEPCLKPGNVQGIQAAAGLQGLWCLCTSEAVQQNQFGLQKCDGVQKVQDVHVPPSLRMLLLLLLSIPSLILKTCLRYELQRH